MNPPPSSSPISQHLQHVIQGHFFCWRTCAKNQPAAWRGDDDVANVLYSEGGIQTNKVNVCNRGTCWQTYISWLDRSICGPGFCDVSCTVGTSRPLSVFFFGGGRLSGSNEQRRHPVREITPIWLFQGKSSWPCHFNALHFTNFVRFLLISVLCFFTGAICNRLSAMFSIRSGYISESVVKKVWILPGSLFEFWIEKNDYCHPLVWRVISLLRGAFKCQFLAETQVTYSDTSVADQSLLMMVLVNWYISNNNKFDVLKKDVSASASQEWGGPDLNLADVLFNPPSTHKVHRQTFEQCCSCHSHLAMHM